MSFDPVERRQAIWATDARKIAQGNAVQVYLEKLGEVDPPDLSGIEAVQMGHVMQPIIGELAARELGVGVKDLGDTVVQHPTEQWMRSHFDFLTVDGRALIEAKNYNAAVRNKFGEKGSSDVPAADYYQCLHEATVMGMDMVYLAVLFGGQEFCLFPLHFSDQQKDELIAVEAELWGRINAKNPPLPETPEEARKLWPQSRDDAITANQNIEQAIATLKNLKRDIKAYEPEIERLEGFIQSYMQTHGELVSVDGSTLATWKTAKASKRFSADLFKQAMPEMYERFVVEQPGSRRFLIK
jgi:predicted phage-related endonuclease